MKIILLKLIKFYQTILSPDHGGLLSFFKPLGVCKFRPTCSEYIYTAIEKYGVLKGVWLGLKRLLHCHPFAQSDYDPVK